MAPTDYDRFRHRLEQQLRADVELLFEAYRAKLRAFETVAHARGELEESADRPPLALPPGLLALAPAREPAGESPALPSASPAATAAPAAAAGPPSSPAKRKRSYAYEIQDAVEAALGQLGEAFDRNDLCRVLGFVPSRATLHRVMNELLEAGTITIEELGSGRRPMRYRKRTPAVAPAKAEAAS